MEPGPTDTVDHRDIAGPVHLVPQAAHMHVDKVGRRNEFVIPDFLEQHGPRQHLIATLHHVFQQAKLTRQQIDHAISSA